MTVHAAGGRRILVIGGAGYLGSVLTRQLLQDGYAVRVFDAFRFGSESLDEVARDPRLEIVQGDIRRISDVTRALKDVDGVVLLAALVGEPACDRDPAETVDINLIATMAVVDACRYYGIERFVFASTDSVYGIREGVMREESPKNPISLYARLKLRVEEEILARAGSAFRPVLLRMSTLYGASPRMRFDLVVNRLALLAATEGRITIFGGAQWRPFVHVADAAHAYRMALAAPLDLVGGEIFNVGSDEQNYQIGHLEQMVREVFPRVEVQTIPQTPDLRDYFVSCEKIASVLGYRPERSVVDGIREIRDAVVSGRIEDPRAPRFYNVAPA